MTARMMVNSAAPHYERRNEEVCDRDRIVP